MEWGIIVALIIGILIIVFPVVFIWYISIGGIYEAIKGYKKFKVLENALSNLACSVDIDCPPGYICMEGHCVAQ